MPDVLNEADLPKDIGLSHEDMFETLLHSLWNNGSEPSLRLNCWHVALFLSCAPAFIDVREAQISYHFIIREPGTDQLRQGTRLLS